MVLVNNGRKKLRQSYKYGQPLHIPQVLSPRLLTPMGVLSDTLHRVFLFLLRCLLLVGTDDLLQDLTHITG
jgi:hypothetical protein